jgi:hypothetical protein
VTVRSWQKIPNINSAETIMEKKLSLLQGDITYNSASQSDSNILLQLSNPEKRVSLFVHLYKHRDDIQATVARHLGLKKSQPCRVGDFKEWIHGSFNVCIPVYIDNWDKRPGHRVLIRFPLPYKVGESEHPGNADEKVRCEAATFIWIREHCPDIPIPYLWGFGFSNGLDVSLRFIFSNMMLTYHIPAVHGAGEHAMAYTPYLVFQMRSTTPVQIASNFPLHSTNSPR